MNLRVCQPMARDRNFKIRLSSTSTNWFFLGRRLITKMEMRWWGRKDDWNRIRLTFFGDQKCDDEEEDPFVVPTHQVPNRKSPNFQNNQTMSSERVSSHKFSHCSVHIASHVKYLTSMSQAIISISNWCLFYVNLSSNIGIPAPIACSRSRRNIGKQ